MIVFVYDSMDNDNNDGVSTVNVNNLSVTINEWADLWPECIYFFANLSTEGI